MSTGLALAMLAAYALGSALAASVTGEPAGGGLTRLVSVVMAVERQAAAGGVGEESRLP